MLRLIFMAAWLAFVAACSEQVEAPEPEPGPVDAGPSEPVEPGPAETPFEPVERPSVSVAGAEIDWDAARADLASANGNGGDATVQIQSGASAPPVPVLIPQGLGSAQGASADPPRFSGLPDGYFYHLPGAAYDVTVSGTNEVYGTGGAADGDSDTPVFRSTATGAMVSMSRYGADYLVEFECNGAAGALGDSCISDAEALEVARNLVIAATR